MTIGSFVRAPHRAPATLRASAAAIALVALAAVAPRPAAAQASDFDKLIPADALVYVAFDGLQPLQAAVTEFLDGVMPGQGGAMAGMMFMQMQAQPGMGEIDAGKPIYFSFLASEKPLFAIPLANPKDFEALMKTQPGTEEMTILAGTGYSLVSEGPIDLDALRQGSSPKTPVLQGPLRGFVDMPRLLEKYGQQLDDTLAMLASMQGESASGQVLDLLSTLRGAAGRVDFAVTPSKAGLEFAFSAAPSGDGFVSTIAKSSAPTGAGIDKLAAALPADSIMAGSMSLLPGAYKSFLGTFAKGMASGPMGAFLDKMQTVMTGAGVFAMTPSASGLGSAVHAYGVTDPVRARSLMNEAWKDSALMSSMATYVSPGSTMTVDAKLAAAPIDGVDYDEIRCTITAGPDATAADKEMIATVAKVYADPILVAYAPTAMVLVSGPNGRQRLEQALAGHKSGGSSSAAVKALPQNKSIAVAVNLVGMMKAVAASNPEAMMGPLAMLSNLPPGTEYVTMSVTPVGGMAEMRLNLTSGALRELVGPMMGGMGPR